MNEINIRKDMIKKVTLGIFCHIGNILVQVVPEGCINEIKLIALISRHFIKI